jgi:menaquinone-dependent protoporphyrinogen IX oxidase
MPAGQATAGVAGPSARPGEAAGGGAPHAGRDDLPYRAVIAGSGIQNKQWLPEAMQFMRANQAALNSKPCAVFLVCMTLAMKNGETYRTHVSDFMAPVRLLVRPVSEGLFAGALDISKVPSFKDRLGFKISVKTGVWTEGDHRDWEAIRTWSASLPPRLQG